MKKQGFTLVELMVVIAIIGLLTAVALPRFTGVTESAKAAQVQANLASLRTAIGMFHAKTGQYPNINGDNKNKLDTIVVDGVRFTDFYSKNKIPEIPGWKGHESSNLVIIGKKFTGDGGWLYVRNTVPAIDGTEDIPFEEDSYGKKRRRLQVGQIYANISVKAKDDPFNQGINWLEY